MKTLFRLLRKYRLHAVLGPLFKLLEALFELMVPVVVAYIIDRGISLNDTSAIKKGFIVLILFGIVGFVCSVTAQYFAARAAVGTSCELRVLLLDKIQNLSFRQVDRIGIPSLITRMTSDINLIQNGLNLFLRLMLRSPFVVIGAAVMAMTIDLKLSLIFFTVIACLSFVVYVITRLSLPANRAVQELLDSLTVSLRDTLTGTRVIRAFRMEERERDRFEGSCDDLKKRQSHAGNISAWLNPLTYALLNSGIIVLLYCSSVSVRRGAITAGSVVALYNYMTQILVELLKFANLIVTVSKSAAGMKRVDEIMAEEYGMKFADELTENADASVSLRFENVSLSYDGSGNAVDGVSFAVGKGSIVGIIGGTGSGKSTVANLIERIYDPTEGTVYIDGIDIKKYPKKELRRKIGYVTQRPVLFRGTVRENLLMSDPSADDKAVEDAVDASLSSDILETKADGIQETVETGGRNFSGGQRQRLGIARALVRRPEILILDDSTSSLDFTTASELRKNLTELDYSPTVIIISQRISAVFDADQILVIDDGRLTASGKHGYLLSQCSVYREIYDSQFGGGER